MMKSEESYYEMTRGTDYDTGNAVYVVRKVVGGRSYDVGSFKSEAEARAFCGFGATIKFGSQYFQMWDED